MASEVIKLSSIGGEGFRKLLDDAPLTSFDRLLTDKKRLRLMTLSVLALGDKKPSPQIALSTLYFFQLIRTWDDAIDSRDISDFADTASLNEYLLNREVAFSDGRKASEVLEGCLVNCTPDKKEAVNLFVDQMLAYHLRESGKGKPGEYSFKDPLSYRNATNNPLADTVGILIDQPDKVRLRSICHAVQLVDDGLDWAEDFRKGTLNYFVGMATDVWHSRGNPRGEDLDCLRDLSGKWPVNSRKLAKAKVDALYGIKNPHMKATRDLYRQEILSQVPVIGGKGGKILSTLAHLLF